MRKELIFRRKKQQRIRGIITISALIMCIIIVFTVSGLSTNARSVNDHPEYKYFMSYDMVIHYGYLLLRILMSIMTQ